MKTRTLFLGVLWAESLLAIGTGVREGECCGLLNY